MLHNTVASTQAPFSSIEWRFDRTDVEIVNNLVSHNLMDRGGTASLDGNLVDQPLSSFVDGAGGDLHLAAMASVAIDGVTAPADVPDDIDGDPRPLGSASDVGADEYGEPAPSTVTDLHVARAVADGGALTATLRWTAPAGAVTTTLRYADAPISAGSWDSASPLTDTLPGDSTAYTSSVPYGGGTVYFALRSQNGAGESGLSNNAFWPYVNTYLPLVLRSE